jgi:hypothetical protein
MFHSHKLDKIRGNAPDALKFEFSVTVMIDFLCCFHQILMHFSFARTFPVPGGFDVEQEAHTYFNTKDRCKPGHAW